MFYESYLWFRILVRWSIFSLWINPTVSSEFQFYWYYDSACFGQSFCPSSGVLSRTSALVHVMQIWRPFATRSRMELQFHPAPGSKRSSQLHKMYQSRGTAKNSWWWAERLPETYRVVILIKLEFSANCWFYSQGISYDARSYDRKKKTIYCL